MQESKQIPCSTLLKPQYRIDGTWYSIIENSLIKSDEPFQLSAVPKVIFDFNYQKKHKLLLTDEQLAEYQQTIKIVSIQESVGKNLILSYVGDYPMNPSYIQAKSESNWLSESRKIFDAVGLGKVFDYIALGTYIILAGLLCYLLFQLFMTIATAIKIYKLKGHLSWGILSSFTSVAREQVNTKNMKNILKKNNDKILELESKLSELTNENNDPENPPNLNSNPPRYLPPRLRPSGIKMYPTILKETSSHIENVN